MNAVFRVLGNYPHLAFLFVKPSVQPGVVVADVAVEQPNRHDAIKDFTSGGQHPDQGKLREG